MRNSWTLQPGSYFKRKLVIFFIQSRAAERGVLFPGSRYLADPKTINKCLKGLLKLSILDPEWAWRLIKINRRSDERGEKRSGQSCKLFKCDPNSILSKTFFRVEIFEIRRFPVVVWTYKNGNFQKWYLREQESLLAWDIKKKCLTSLCIERFCLSLKENNSSFGATVQGSLWKQTPFSAHIRTRVEKRASVIFKFKNGSKLKDATEVILIVVA